MSEKMTNKCNREMATKPEFLVTKGEMIVALATDMVAISSPVFAQGPPGDDR